MNFDPSALLAGFIFGVIGFYLLKWARAKGHIQNLLIGIALMAYPYFVENIFLLWGIGVGLCALAYKLRDS